MKVILEFDDLEDAAYAMNAYRYRGALWEFMDWIRNKYKHGTGDMASYDEIWTAFSGALLRAGLDWDLDATEKPSKEE